MQGMKDIAEMHWKHDLLGSIEVGIVVLNRDYEVQVWNLFMENHSNIIPSKIRNKSLFDFFPEIDCQWFKAKSEPVFSLKSPVFVIWEQRPFLFRFGANRPITSGSEFMFQNITIFPLASLTGRVEQICIVVYDVTVQALNIKAVAALNSQLLEISRVDDLTGLFNRRYWEEQFCREFKRNLRTKAQSSLIMLDIDNLKKINDTYGHPAEDEVIRSLAEIVKKTTRETDFCGRYYDKKLTILLPDTAAESVQYLAERICRLVEKRLVQYQQHNIAYTVSLGVAQFDNIFSDHSHWLERAQNALYKAKEAGHNQVVIA
jgi:diguanylate cyclase